MLVEYSEPIFGHTTLTISPTLHCHTNLYCLHTLYSTHISNDRYSNMTSLLTNLPPMLLSYKYSKTLLLRPPRCLRKNGFNIELR